MRIFNSQGVEEFRRYLQMVREGNPSPPSEVLLFSDTYSEEAGGAVEVERRLFTEKADMVRYLAERIEAVREKYKLYNQGLWTWLSAYYFDSVCPLRGGVRRPGADARHILASKEWNRYYRHLLAAPVRLYLELHELGDIYLLGSPDQHGALFEQLASQNEYATSRGVLELVKLLYWDVEKGRLKRGALNSAQHPGVLKRLTGSFLPQIGRIYDVNGMRGEQILGLLPEEFGEWMPR